MEITTKNNVPVSAFAAAGVCTVAPMSAFYGGASAVASPLAAKLPQSHQARTLTITQDPAGVKLSYTGPETKPSNKIGSFRGVPPRGRPV